MASKLSYERVYKLTYIYIGIKSKTDTSGQFFVMYETITCLGIHFGKKNKKKPFYKLPWC